MGVLVGQRAPDFTANAILKNGEIISDFSLSRTLNGKYGLVFFYPLNFTFVCPSELIALNHRISDFESRNIVVVVISTDSHFSHNAWRNKPINEGGIGSVDFTMVADITHDICRAYDVENEIGVALRGAFLIDKTGVVRAQIVNDLVLGRNIEELLRTFDAIDFTNNHGEVCPANWVKGAKGIIPTPQGVSDYLSEHFSTKNNSTNSTMELQMGHDPQSQLLAVENEISRLLSRVQELDDAIDDKWQVYNDIRPGTFEDEYGDRYQAKLEKARKQCEDFEKSKKGTLTESRNRLKELEATKQKLNAELFGGMDESEDF